MRRIVVRRSPIDGRGVFALTNIQSGELLVEYKSEVTCWSDASQRYQRNSAEDGHTFFFGLDGGHVIDGARGGNSARWLNHCCEPNCEAEQEGSRVFIRALADIMVGEELFVDYRLDVKGRRTAAIRKPQIHSRCGSQTNLTPAKNPQPVGQKKWRHGCGHLYDPVKVRAVRIASRQLRSEKPLLG